MAESRLAPSKFATRPRSLKEISDAGDSLGMDVLFEPQHQWIAEEYLATEVPDGWLQCIDPESQKPYYWNESTGATLWDNPAEAQFKSMYENEKRKSAAGLSVAVLASRVDARNREQEAKKLDRPPAGSRRNSVAFQVGVAMPAAADDADVSRPPSESRRRASVKWEVPEGGMVPAQLIELAVQLGIQMQCAPAEKECHLMHFVSEYLTRLALGALPPSWEQYADENGYPYYYNNVTGETTYDYPVIIELAHKVEAARKFSAEDPELGPAYRGSAIHRYWAFGDGSKVYYYNLMNGDVASTPPNIGQRATTLVQKRVRGFLTRLRMKAKEKKLALAAGGLFGSGALDQSTWGEESKGTDDASRFAKLESDKWEREKAQRDVLGKLHVVLSRYAQDIENGGDGRWTMPEYDQVLQLMRMAHATGLSDVKDEFGLKGGPVVKEVQGIVRRFEEAEGRRRAEQKRKAIAEAKAQQLASKISAIRELGKAKEKLQKLRKQRFTEAKANPSLNGELYENSVVRTAWHAASKVLNEAIAVAPKAPTDELNDKALSTLTKLVAQATREVASLERKVNAEIRTRQQSEYVAMRMADDTAKRAEAAAATAAEEQRRAEEQRKLDEEAKAVRRAEMEAKLKKDYEARIQREKERKLEMERERVAMEAELKRIREERDERERKEKERLEQWNLMTFASEQDRDEVMVQRQLEDQRIAAQAAKAEREEEERQERIRSQMEARKAAIAEQQAEIARQIAEREAEEARLTELRMKEEAAFREEQERRRKIEEARLAKQQARLAEIERKRAMMDEGDSDTEEEKAARDRAKIRLAEYTGDVFTAARDNDVGLVRSFFLVQGTKLLTAHSKAPNDGGRTLVHVAAWWGCAEVLQLLIDLGADLDGIDSMFSCTTPLMEAVRAGRRRMAEVLLENGADIRKQDYAGDTVLHWAARRGWGSLLVALLRKGEAVKPGSTRGLIDVKNHKKKTAQDVAANQTIQELIAQEMQLDKRQDKRRAVAASRMRKGLIKAKVMGANVGATASNLKAQRLRYGRVRTNGRKRSTAGAGRRASVAKRSSMVGNDSGLAALGLLDL